ncbi:MAG: hypothetical protein IE933_12370 [Sphingomonadales bacterium]|nr:hypothetical protein [Sphingomonadales bacterium]MBD3772499.1 hypothetical protein [Paracoccaceae bacterium]
MSAPSSVPAELRLPALLFTALLAACKPPAADDYSAREEAANKRDAPSTPIESPDVSRAIWAESGQGARLLYGNPGELPLLVLSCEGSREAPVLRIIREAPADKGAKALFALIGNGHAERLPVDASWTGKRWLWEASFAAADPRMEVFDGPREVEATLPGGGTLVLKPSPLPGAFLHYCRGDAVSAAPEQ